VESKSRRQGGKHKTDFLDGKEKRMNVSRIVFCVLPLLFLGGVEEARAALTRTVSCKYQVHYSYSTKYDKSNASNRWANIAGTSFKKTGQASGPGRRRRAKDNAWTQCMGENDYKPDSRRVKNTVESNLPTNAFYKILEVRMIGTHSDDTIGTQRQDVKGLAMNRWYQKGKVECIGDGRQSDSASLCCSRKRAKSVNNYFCVNQSKTCGWINTPGLNKFTLKDYKGKKYYCSPKNKAMVRME
jgi:hypothetical protein